MMLRGILAGLRLGRCTQIIRVSLSVKKNYLLEGRAVIVFCYLYGLLLLIHLREKHTDELES
jgi:hypothetical protein